MSDVILLSGGIESTTLMYIHSRQNQLHPVFIDYGQRAGKAEYRAAAESCKHLGIKLKKIDMAQAGHDFRADQTKKMHVPLPHRNLIALSLGLSYATQIHAERVLLALNKEDTLAYPSASLTFIDQFQALASTLGETTIAAPLAGFTKAQIIQQGLHRGVNYAHTYSCLLGYTLHCGHCPQCLHRRAAFKAANTEEPVGFYRA